MTTQHMTEQDAITDAYDRGWHEAGERLHQAETQLEAMTEDNHTLRAALWEIHRMLTSDGPVAEPIDIIRHVETTLRWNIE